MEDSRINHIKDLRRKNEEICRLYNAFGFNRFNTHGLRLTLERNSLFLNRFYFVDFNKDFTLRTPSTLFACAMAFVIFFSDPTRPYRTTLH